MRRLLRVTVLASLLAAIGCSPLAPRPDYSKFFVLTSSLDTAADSSTAAGKTDRMAIGLGPIRFPDYLQRLEMVTRVSSNRLEVSPVNRWAEPLDRNFARILTENLAQLLNTENIVQYPWPRRTATAYQIAIDVHRFENNGDGRSQLSAGWIIKDGPTGKILYSAHTNATSAVAPDDAGAARALSKDLGVLSQQIASAVNQLNQSRRARSGAV
jgi:uncharacterized protein